MEPSEPAFELAFFGDVARLAGDLLRNRSEGGGAAAGIGAGAGAGEWDFVRFAGEALLRDTEPARLAGEVLLPAVDGARCAAEWECFSSNRRLSSACSSNTSS